MTISVTWLAAAAAKAEAAANPTRITLTPHGFLVEAVTRYEGGKARREARWMVSFQEADSLRDGVDPLSPAVERVNTALAADIAKPAGEATGR